MAYNTYGDSEYSNEVTVTVTGSSPPSAPRELTATNHIGYVGLSWLTPSSEGSSVITGYEVFRDGSSIAMLGAGVRYYDDIWGSAGVNYTYTVTAFNSVGDSPASNGAIGKNLVAEPPSAPLNLQAGSHIGSVSLSWEAPSYEGTAPVIRYDIFRGTSAGGEGSTPIGNVAVGTQTYTDTTGTAGQTYYYKVKAVNSVDRGPASNEVWGAFIPPQVPSAPRNLVATSGISYVVLNWEEPTSSGSSTIIRYDVYRGTTLGVSLLIGETAVGVLTYNDTAAVGGTSYHYQVVAVNAEGNSPESNDAQATPLAPQAPSAPRNLVADFGNAYVQLRWDAPTNSGTSPITGYAVLRGTSLGDISYLVDTTTAGVLNLNDTSVSNGVTYYYQVRAMNAVGGSPMSNTVTANPTGPMPPSVPREVTARGALTYVILNWTAPESEGSFAIIRYDIYRGTNASNVNLLVGSVAAGVLIYNDTSVASHFGYYYVVKAVNGVGPSAASNLAYTTTNEDQGPTQPRNLRAEAGNGFVKLQWDLPYQQGTQPIVRYYVYRGTSSSEIYTLVGWANAPLREFNDTSVLNGNTYFYAVVAASSAGNSGPSNTVQGTTSGPAVPSAPQNLLAQGRPGMVNLTWDASAGSGILRYDIFRGTSEGSISSTPIGNTASGLAYSDATITAGTVYFYKVKAVNSVGSSPYSNAANATATAALPGAPQNLVATPGAGKVTLTWAAPATSGGSAITGYKVYLALLGGAVNIANVSGSTLSYVDSTGTSGTTYTYYVVAVNAVGSGAVSGQASASPQAASAADNTMLYVGIAIAIIVVIAIVVMLMRRKK